MIDTYIVFFGEVHKVLLEHEPLTLVFLHLL
jgi:hypothetical protein